MKTIILTQGQVAVVDDADFDALNKDKWFANWNVGTQSFYAYRKIRLENGKQSTEAMHRRIMGLTVKDKLCVDHINHNTLCNTRSNLVIKTTTENGANRTKRAKATSKFVGVYWNTHSAKWLARIQVNGKRLHLGVYENETMAALAFNEAAAKNGFLTRNTTVFDYF